MSIIITILVFIAIFSLLIFIHEFGHFAAAKRAGVEVEEFGFGLPPRMFGVKKGETIYSINWVPFGGFVRMLGEDGKRRGKSLKNFQNQPLRKQAWIVSAGVVMNLLLAFALLTLGFWVGIEPLVTDRDDLMDAVREGHLVLEVGAPEEEEALYLPRLTSLGEEGSLFLGYMNAGEALIAVDGVQVLDEMDLLESLRAKESVSLSVWNGEVLREVNNVILPEVSPIISYVEPGFPADESGLKVGDEVLQIGEQRIFKAEQVMPANMAQEDQGTVNYFVLRNGEEILISLELNEEGRVGIGLADPVDPYGSLSFYSRAVEHELIEMKQVQYGFIEAPFVAVQEMWRLGKITSVMFFDVLGGFLRAESVPDGVAGPVGIAQMTHVSLQEGPSALLRFVALLSLSLGVINILPLPALDGGRLLFILVQGITGKKTNARIEHLIHTSGFLLLIAFILYVTVNDVMGLF